jgi:ATP-dependent DNA helicase RecQ
VSLIGRLTKLPGDVLIQQLHELTAFGIINYHPQKETPQVYFAVNRAPANYLSFNHEAYLERKKQYALRLEAMLNYIDLSSACRSRFIGNYFGDREIKNCGVCDNCLQQKNTVLTPEEFIIIKDRIIDFLPDTGSEVKALLLHLAGLKKEKVWKVLDYLQAEKNISINEAGLIFRK